MKPLLLLSFVIVLGASSLYCFSSIILVAFGMSSSLSPVPISSTAAAANTMTNATLDEVSVLNSKGVALNSLGSN